MLRSLLDDAHRETRNAITDIRALTRGLHPPILTDRGLDAALSSVAALCSVPVGHQHRSRIGRKFAAYGHHGVDHLLPRIGGTHQRDQTRASNPRDRFRRASRAKLEDRSLRQRTRRRSDPTWWRTCRAGGSTQWCRRKFARREFSRRPNFDCRGGTVRVMLADDSVLLREGIKRLLTDHGVDVTASVGDAEDLLKELSDVDVLPDVCVVDVRMPPTFLDEGLRAALVIPSNVACCRRSRPLPIRRGKVCRRTATKSNRRRRLPSQRPRRGRRRICRRRQPGGRWWDRNRPGCRATVTRSCTQGRSPGQTHSTRTRSAHSDGAGPVQLGDRGHLGHRACCCRKAHRQYLHQTRSVQRLCGPPPSSCGPQISGAT